MAAPLRYPLILLAWGRWRRSICRCSPPPGTGGRCALPGPLAGAVRRPAAEPGAGRHLVSTLLSVGGRAADRPDHRRRPLAFGPLRRLASRLPLLLAVPHLALATAALLLFAEGGWLWQQLPFLTQPVDRTALGLA
ncbi:ABC transporter permease [Klebsiella pneumoniae]|uniref:ABC transporter permease n=1 Tax=Klebsiella pneumoniae TaxID=573 RepID=A0A4P0Y3L3_KLEPN|nr:ABC transporter permease [Klebsiella pneumoniae]